MPVMSDQPSKPRKKRKQALPEGQPSIESFWGPPEAIAARRGAASPVRREIKHVSRSPPRSPGRRKRRSVGAAASVPTLARALL